MVNYHVVKFALGHNRYTTPAMSKYTDIFGFKNAQPKNRADEPDREFYLARLDEIWYGCSCVNTEWGYRSNFVISTGGLRYWFTHSELL